MPLVQPATSTDWAAAQRLVRVYADSLGIDLSFQDFDRELADLEREYGPPDGAFILAEHAGSFVGCGAFRRAPITLHPTPGTPAPGTAPAPSTHHPAPSTRRVCEMKRLYVTPAGRGQGIGRAIAERLIADARVLGYRAMRLDTLPTMTAARRMYAELGFKEIEPYRYNPVEGTTFLELSL